MGFIAVQHFPNAITNIKMIHRLVILPDYQGIGLGTRLMTLVAHQYAEKGFYVRIVTTSKNLMMALLRNDSWKLTCIGDNEKHKHINKNLKSLNRTLREVRVYSFAYSGINVPLQRNPKKGKEGSNVPRKRKNTNDSKKKPTKRKS